MSSRLPTRLWAAAALGSLLIAGGAPLRAQQGGGDALLAQERVALTAVCSRCHNLQVVSDAAMSYPAWHDTVQSMIDRGAQATDEQLDDIMDYLHRTVTTVDVNTADADELALVLDLPDAVVNAIVIRRKAHKFETLADLKSVPGINAAAIDAKAKLLFFK